MKGSGKTRLDEEAYKRDGFKCVDCGSSKGLEAHHLIYIEKLENLVTLCHSCHKKRHNMSGCFIKGFDPRRGNKPNKTSFKKGRTAWNKGLTFN